MFLFLLIRFNFYIIETEDRFTNFQGNITHLFFMIYASLLLECVTIVKVTSGYVERKKTARCKDSLYLIIPNESKKYII